MVKKSLLLRQSLSNGLVLEVYDHSRPMAGDRWQVILEVRVPIPVSEEVLAGDLKERAAEVIEALGPEITFSLQEIHHFIDAREVPALLEEMQNRLLQGLSEYLSHSDFARRYLKKKFAEYQERQRWYPPE
jgi:hypothetical protein